MATFEVTIHCPGSNAAILNYTREPSQFGYEVLQCQIAMATKRRSSVFYATAQEAGRSPDEATSSIGLRAIWLREGSCCQCSAT